MVRILLADDNEAFRTSMCEILEGNGFEVTEARGGLEASSLLATSFFDVFITDILMPDKDGMELLNEIRTKGIKLKVIVITGGGRIEAENYLNLVKNHPVVCATFSKPLDHSRLISTIQSICH